MKKRIGIILLVIVALAIPYVKYVRKAQAACDPLATPTFTARGNFTRCFTNQCSWNTCLQAFIDEVSTRVALLGTAFLPGEFIDKGNEVFDVRAYGALGNGSNNDSTGIQAAATACDAAARDGVVFIPAGTWKMDSGVTITNCTLKGAGIRSTVLAPSASLAGGTAITFNAATNGGSLHQGGLEDFEVFGPGSAPSLGNHPSPAVNCIQLNNSAFVNRVRVTQCDKGIITNATQGHQSFIEAEGAQNFYTIFKNSVTGGSDGGDDTYLNSNFSATFAIMGVATNAQIGGMKVFGGTWGVAPYVVFQEQGTQCVSAGNPLTCCTAVAGQCAGPFMGTVAFYDTHFENIGNAAIASNNVAAGGNGGLIGAVSITRPGYVATNTQNLATASCLTGGAAAPTPWPCCRGAGSGCEKSYAINVGVLNSLFYEDAGVNALDNSGLSGGGVGALSFTQITGQARIDLPGYNTTLGSIVATGTNPQFVQINRAGHNNWLGLTPAATCVACDSTSYGILCLDSDVNELCYCNGAVTNQNKWCQVRQGTSACGTATSCN